MKKLLLISMCTPALAMAGGLDPTIPLQTRVPHIMSPFELEYQAQQLRLQQQQIEMNRLQIERMRQQQEELNRLQQERLRQQQEIEQLKKDLNK